MKNLTEEMFKLVQEHKEHKKHKSQNKEIYQKLVIKRDELKNLIELEAKKTFYSIG